MSKLQTLGCPQCGSTDLTEIAWNKRRCQHCGAYALLSDDRASLEVIERQCPKCGFNNEREARYCGECGGPLIKHCPRCGAEMKWSLAFCTSCGQDYEVLA
jgi:ribosomal protein S27AE